MEYEYDVDAVTGEILKFEAEALGWEEDDEEDDDDLDEDDDDDLDDDDD